MELNNRQPLNKGGNHEEILSIQHPWQQTLHGLQQEAEEEI